MESCLLLQNSKTKETVLQQEPLWTKRHFQTIQHNVAISTYSWTLEDSSGRLRGIERRLIEMFSLGTITQAIHHRADGREMSFSSDWSST
jgi:hypothetical protein